MLRFSLLLALVLCLSCNAFSPSFVPRNSLKITRSTIVVNSSGSEDADVESASSAKQSLEEKMKTWEATEEETKAATLGGLVPTSERSDAFDIGLYIAFPLMVISGLLFLLFPFIIGSIDTTSVGPPPTS